MINTDQTNEMRATLVSAGFIPVPRGTYVGDFAEMEENFRSLLWPMVWPGYQRWRRDLRFNGPGTELRYEIWDVEETLL